jgi:predicted molibdopterin-dependent oxidoreductase YjgC
MLRRDLQMEHRAMSDGIQLRVNTRTLIVPQGTIVAAAVALADVKKFRNSVSGHARAPLCGMGVCMECRVTINGQAHQRSCQTLCESGMEVRTDA